MKYIAFVTKGLEKICEEELKTLNGVKILGIQQKFIIFKYSGDVSCLKNLKTIDDISIYVSEIPAEQMISLDLEKEVEKLKEVLDFVGEYRKLENTFAITVGKYKNNDIKEIELKDQLSKFFSQKLKLEYSPLDHTNIDVRININEDNAIISMKLFPNSLYKRDYDHIAVLGSIRSTIAASMIFKLDKKVSSLKLVDNFCGSGTFLCEALSKGFVPYGGDIDINAVNITKENLNKVSNKSFKILELDATSTNWPNDYFDIAVSNLPWGKQIKINRLVKLFDMSVKEYSRILKKEAQLGFITAKPDLLVKYIKKYFDIQNIAEYKIGYLGQTPTIILAKVKKK